MSCALYMKFRGAVSDLVAEEKRRIMSELRKKKPQESSMCLTRELSEG